MLLVEAWQRGATLEELRKEKFLTKDATSSIIFNSSVTQPQNVPLTEILDVTGSGVLNYANAQIELHGGAGATTGSAFCVLKITADSENVILYSQVTNVSTGNSLYITDPLFIVSLRKIYSAYGGTSDTYPIYPIFYNISKRNRSVSGSSSVFGNIPENNVYNSGSKIIDQSIAFDSGIKIEFGAVCNRESSSAYDSSIIISADYILD